MIFVNKISYFLDYISVPFLFLDLNSQAIAHCLPPEEPLSPTSDVANDCVFSVIMTWCFCVLQFYFPCFCVLWFDKSNGFSILHAHFSDLVFCSLCHRFRIACSSASFAFALLPPYVLHYELHLFFCFFRLRWKWRCWSR